MMQIREATESDALGIAEVLKQISEIKSVATVSLEEIHKRIGDGLAVITRTGTSTVLVGLSHDGNIAGYCSVHWVPFLFFEGGEAYVTELFIRPGNRGSGLGSLLMSEVEKRARERGCTRLSLLNGRDSESYKRKFYSKRKWVEREQIANFVLPIEKEKN